jgi:hypothetical protein
VLIILLIVLVAFSVYLFVIKNKTKGKIDADTRYILTETPTKYYSQILFGTTLTLGEMQNSWFTIDGDKKTGTFRFYNTDPITFIITEYNQGFKKTTFSLEYIHDGQFFGLLVFSTADGIEFKLDKKYEVSITKQNPEAINEINYESRILYFVKEKK